MSDDKINKHCSLTMTKTFYWLIGMLIFLLPLFNAWMLYPLGIENIYTLYPALGGILPWSDAGGYYTGANTLIEYGSLDAWNTRRPLNALLFAVRLWLANNNFQIALIIQALLCGFSCLLVTKCIARTFGKVSSIASFFMLFLFAAVFIPTTLTETLGLTLGCLAFVFLWEGLSIKKARLFFYAGLMLVIGLNTRAGAFFILPLIILWLGFYFQKNSLKSHPFNWPFIIAFALGIATSFLFNMIILKIYNAPTGGAMHGNFAYTLFGFVSGGKTWDYAQTIYPELLGKAESEVATFLYNKSYEIFKANPFLLLVGFFKNVGALFKSFINFFQSKLPANILIRIFLYSFIISGACFGIWRFKKLYETNKDEISLIIFTLIGMLLSAGTIWKDGGFRVFAVTVPFFAAAFGAVFGNSRSIHASTKTPLIHHNSIQHNSLHWEATAAFVFSAFLLILGLLGPLAINLFKSPLKIPNFSCSPGEMAMVTKKIFNAPYINLEREASKFRKAVLRANIEEPKAFLRILEPDILKAPMALSLVYNLNDQSTRYIVAPLGLFSDQAVLTGLCVTEIPDTKSIIFQVNAFEGLK